MTDLRDSLAQVQELLGRAAPGEWRVDQERRVYIAEAYVCDANIRHTEYDNEATANAIAAAVNLLRTHGHEIEAAVRFYKAASENLPPWQWNMVHDHAERLRKAAMQADGGG